MASIEHAGNEEICRQLTFALVGAGTARVEMAGTLAEMSRMELGPDFRYINPKSARILLYEAGPRILPAYPADLSIKALGRWFGNITAKPPEWPSGDPEQLSWVLRTGNALVVSNVRLVG